MKEFIFTYYRELIAGLCFFIEFFFSIVILVKKSKKEPGIYNVILNSLPILISKAEKVIGSGNGESKLKYVLDAVYDIFIKETGQNPTVQERKLIIEAIEDILKTPQKKG